MQRPGASNAYHPAPGLCLQPFDTVNESKILFVSGRSNPGVILQTHDSTGKPLTDITALDGLLSQAGSVFAVGGNFYTLPTNALVKIDGVTGETIYNVARAHPASACDGTYWAGIEVHSAGSGLTSTWWVVVYFYSAADGSYIGSLESAHRVYAPFPYYQIIRAGIVSSGSGFTVYLWTNFNDAGGGGGWQTGYCTLSGWDPDPVNQARIARLNVTTPSSYMETANYTMGFFVGNTDMIHSFMYTAKGGVSTSRMEIAMPNTAVVTAFAIPGMDTIVFNACSGLDISTMSPGAWTGSYKWDVGAGSVTLLNADYLVVSPMPTVDGVPYALVVEKALVGASPHEWEYYVMNLTTGAVALFGKSLP